jgi:hypothetical protein
MTLPRPPTGLVGGATPARDIPAFTAYIRRQIALLDKPKKARRAKR